MESLDGYLRTVSTQWARVLGGYRVVDIAHKVVGVGSVGLRAYLALCEGSSSDDVLFLQLKQARRSVVARFVHGDQAWHAHQGQRVVEYQKALQTVSDPLLGWTTVGDRQYYVRQFRDMKGAVVVDGLDAAALADYAGRVRPAPGQGPRPHERRVDDRGIPRGLGQGGGGAEPVRPPLRRPDRARPRRPARRDPPRRAARRTGDLGGLQPGEHAGTNG